MSITDRAEVSKLTGWSSKRSKAKVFDEIDFDQIVTNAAIRDYLEYIIPDHLGYIIPENKTLLNMKGKAKKTNGAIPGAAKGPAKKRTVDPEALVSKKVAKKKKIPTLSRLLFRDVLPQ